MNAAQGPAIGMAVLTFFGTVWWLASIRFSRFTRTRVTLVAVGVLILIAVTAHYVMARAHASVPAGPAPDWTLFSYATNGEWIIILIGAAALRAVKRSDLIISLVAVVVGLHFIPLEWVFGAPLYYFTAAGCILGAAAAFAWKDPDQRRAVTCALNALTLWATVALIYLTE